MHGPGTQQEIPETGSELVRDPEWKCELKWYEVSGAF